MRNAAILALLVLSFVLVGLLFAAIQYDRSFATSWIPYAALVSIAAVMAVADYFSWRR